MANHQPLNEHGEETILDVHPHWSTLTVPAVVVAALLALTGVLSSHHWLHGIAASLSLIVWLIALAWAGVHVIAYLTTRLTVTNLRIIFVTGVLTRKTSEIQLDRVTNTSTRRTLFERLVGSGDLVVESAGKDGQDYFHHVPRPDHIRQTISSLLVRTQAPSTSAASVADQLERLSQLHRAGSLSDAEFAAAKARLLN